MSETFFYHSKEKKDQIKATLQANIQEKKDNLALANMNPEFINEKKNDDDISNPIEMISNEKIDYDKAIKPVIQDYTIKNIPREDVIQRPVLAQQHVARDIDLSDSFTAIRANDTDYMQTVRNSMHQYLEHKEMFESPDFKTLSEADQRWVLENAIDSLNAMIKDCTSYIWGRWYCVLGTSHSEMRSLRIKAKNELKEVKKRYIKFMDQKGINTDAASADDDYEVFYFTKSGYLRAKV